jgi:hypothetical protein
MPRTEQVTAAEIVGDPTPTSPVPTPPSVPDLIALLRTTADALEATQEVTTNAAAAE